MYCITQCIGEVYVFFKMGSAGVVVVVKCGESREVLSLYMESEKGSAIVFIFSFLAVVN